MSFIDLSAVKIPLIHAPEVHVLEVESEFIDQPCDQGQLFGRAYRAADARWIVGGCLPPGAYILQGLCEGRGAKGDVERLEQLAHQIRDSSHCALGGTAPNPVLSTIRYFRDEYEAHIAGKCPAGICKALVTYSITDDCIGCTRCAQRCPADAIAMRPYERHEIDQEECIRCGTCREVCPVEAVEVE